LVHGQLRGHADQSVAWWYAFQSEAEALEAVGLRE
jgi:hypothetical protein